ncbi:MAG: hypothetical protein ACK40O_13645, partial [Allosphingosinicella sp.]
VWALALLIVAVAAIWGWREMQRTPDFALELPALPDTVPEIVAGLGGARPADLSEADYGDLWVIDRAGGATRKESLGGG